MDTSLPSSLEGNGSRQQQLPELIARLALQQQARGEAVVQQVPPVLPGWPATVPSSTVGWPPATMSQQVQFRQAQQQTNPSVGWPTLNSAAMSGVPAGMPSMFAASALNQQIELLAASQQQTMKLMSSPPEVVHNNTSCNSTALNTMSEEDENLAASLMLAQVQQQQQQQQQLSNVSMMPTSMVSSYDLTPVTSFDDGLVPANMYVVETTNPAAPIRGMTSSLYVKNLPLDANELFMYQKFAPFGAILSCRVHIDQTTGKCKGVGFVNFADQSSAVRAMHSLHGTKTPSGHKLHITLQVPRAVRGPPL